MENKKAIIVMDYINEIVHPEGKFKGKGYADFCKENGTIDNVNNAVKIARDKDFQVIYVKVGFKEDYSNQPKGSLLFGKANEFEALKLNTWATEFYESLDVRETDDVIVKNRVSPFYKTDLEQILQKNNISELYFCGVSTDLVVQSAVRDAHDRDYKVVVLEDCCGAGNKEDHDNSINTLKKISIIDSYKNLWIFFKNQLLSPNQYK